jgi:hypothetical protein
MSLFRGEAKIVFDGAPEVEIPQVSSVVKVRNPDSAVEIRNCPSDEKSSRPEEVRLEIA